MKKTAAILMVVASAAPCARAAFFGRLAHTQSTSAISLRKRVHVNTLITEPGTMEVEFASLYSVSGGDWSLPSTFKYTPEGPHIAWGRTEYSVSFDSLTNTDFGGGRLTQFSQSVSLAGTAVLFDGEKLDIAIAPQATFFLRDESGARIGATAITRYDVGQNSIGGTLSWSGATHPSPTNPAGTLDAGLGFGRRLAPGGWLGHLTPHVNAVWERSTGVPWTFSFFEGMEYQVTERFALDVSGQHFAITGGTPDHQIVVGTTFNLGHKH